MAKNKPISINQNCIFQMSFRVQDAFIKTSKFLLQLTNITAVIFNDFTQYGTIFLYTMSSSVFRIYIT